MGSLATPWITRLECLIVGPGMMARAQWHGTIAWARGPGIVTVARQNNGMGQMARADG
jgi:hypothetical protein